MDNQGTQLLGATARLLAGESLDKDALAESARDFAQALGYTELAPSDRAAAVALFRTGAQLERVFQLHAPDAPGLYVFGGEADPCRVGLGGSDQGVASLAGSGLSLRDALEPCIGEGVEYLSQIERGDETLVEGPHRRLDHGHDEGTVSSLLARLSLNGEAASSNLEWCPGRRLADGAPVLIPADLVLRRNSERRGAAPLVPPGLGTAAGPTLDMAVLAGLLELVERDAAALWWHAGQRGRAVPVELLAISQAGPLLDRLRGGQIERRTWLMDISTDLQIPVIVAISVNEKGLGFTCGLAARLDPAEAVRDAILEMCQMELSYHLIEMKRRERGDKALNAADLRHLKRGNSINAHACETLFPLGPSDLFLGRTEADSRSKVVQTVERLSRSGIDAFLVDLTRPAFDVPAVWVCAPGLQPLPGEIITRRLKDAAIKCGKILRTDGILLI